MSDYDLKKILYPNPINQTGKKTVLETYNDASFFRVANDYVVCNEPDWIFFRNL